MIYLVIILLILFSFYLFKLSGIKIKRTIPYYEIRKSKIHGDGSFSLANIEKGTDIGITGQYKINDANFIYPKSYSYEDLFKTFSEYNKNDNNNLSMINDRYVTNRNIRKDTELTRTYGIDVWLKWIALDILDLNGFTDPTNLENIDKEVTNEMVNNLYNLKKVSEELKISHFSLINFLFGYYKHKRINKLLEIFGVKINEHMKD